MSDDIEHIEELSTNKKTFKQFIVNHKLFCIILIALFMILIFSFNFSMLGVSGNSMEPNLHDGMLLFSRKTFMSLDRFDIVVCLDNTQTPIIKRIIGLPNDTIEYKDNNLYINGELVEENYSIGNTKNFKVQIGKDNYYCLGDNREHSKDSRTIGQIPKENIIAEVLF